MGLQRCAICEFNARPRLAKLARTSGARALLAAVLELGMPYTVQRDYILRGFLYGSEPLVDLAVPPTLLQAQNAELGQAPRPAAAALDGGCAPLPALWERLQRA